MGQKTIAIVQSNYIPWRGYFDLIAAVDEFVLYDEVQYTQRDWRNRNRIKTPQGARWLTIPVKKKGRLTRKISETEVSDPHWAEKHWKTIRGCYAIAPFFERYRGLFEDLYLGCEDVFLDRINRRFLTAISEVLGIETPLTPSRSYELGPGKSERLASICLQAGATDYLSGPAARDYLDTRVFADQGIRVHWADYSGYREYSQLYPPFEPAVSVIDLLFNEGPKARNFLKARMAA